MINLKHNSSIIFMVYRTEGSICDPMLSCETEKQANSVILQHNRNRAPNSKSEYFFKPLLLLHDKRHNAKMEETKDAN